jgi:hypothetical protein
VRRSIPVRGRICVAKPPKFGCFDELDQAAIGMFRLAELFRRRDVSADRTIRLGEGMLRSVDRRAGALGAAGGWRASDGARFHTLGDRASTVSIVSASEAGLSSR